MRKRKKIKPIVKRALIEEAGGKCANPGCLNWRAHIHHIMHWAIFESDDPSVLIAVCPTCHDAIHHGRIAITNETLRAWKAVDRSKIELLAFVPIEPGTKTSILAGTITLTPLSHGIIVFDLSHQSKLTFKVEDGDLMLLEVRVSDAFGAEQIVVVNNHVRCRNKELFFQHVPGRVRIEAPMSDRYVPRWLFQILATADPYWRPTQRVVLLDLHVLSPGLVRVQGIWVDGATAVVITEKALMFAHPGLSTPLVLLGEPDTEILYVGAVNAPLFQFDR